MSRGGNRYDVDCNKVSVDTRGGRAVPEAKGGTRTGCNGCTPVTDEARIGVLEGLVQRILGNGNYVRVDRDHGGLTVTTVGKSLMVFVIEDEQRNSVIPILLSDEAAGSLACALLAELQHISPDFYRHLRALITASPVRTEGNGGEQ